MARRPNDPQRRERILQATLDTIAAHGIHAVTHRKIATCANVPLGSLTYYFSGIEALIEEAFSLFTAEMSAQYQQGFVGVTNREQACDAIADLIFSAQVTTARNMELMYQLYAFCSSQPALKAVMQNWMRRTRNAKKVPLPLPPIQHPKTSSTISRSAPTTTTNWSRCF